MKQRIILSKNLNESIAIAISECNHDKIFLLADDNTAHLCLPIIKNYRCLDHAFLITIPPSDLNKNLSSLTHVWQMLSEKGATRHSLLINLGGGMLTDLGGFAAATFKRGINFINIPTTLLAMVDASVGGKTGINFNGLKNEIGAFHEPDFTIIHTVFLQTLDQNNLLSGYAEMLKHALLKNEKAWAETLNFNLSAPDYALLQTIIGRSIKVKEDIVNQDPHEKGLRKALNLGHTVGHAIESLALSKNTPAPLIPHGYAVAFGLLAELYLSAMLKGFPADRLRQTERFIRAHYGTPAYTCKDYDELLALMQHDKKNMAGHINFTLLSAIGQPLIDCSASLNDIRQALDFAREG